MKFKFNSAEAYQIFYGTEVEIEARELANSYNKSNNYLIKGVRLFKSNGLPFTELEINRITSVLLKQNDFKNLEVGGFNYKVIFLKVPNWHGNSDNGYVDLEIMLKPFKYYIKALQTITVVNEKTINIENKGDYEVGTLLECYLDDGNANSINIENRDNNKTTTLSNLDRNEHFYIDADNEYLISKNDKNKDLYSKFNKVYLTLAKGNNEIKIRTSGKIIVNTYWEAKTNLERSWLSGY